ncbi:protein ACCUMULATION AND REPLICATION OF CHLOROPLASTS 3, chloroplastic isoform X2 [Cornus florida]|uniref:protein ACCUMULATION AND REPLICATION OF CHLOROPLASTS 3, chloroplastic isoform X2 n=1 Tax=Cornus florida TaxID=4283 RepID=UPI0028A082AA|nr:protein ACCUMULATION AND REPLICATION OF CHLOROPLASTS 3, chloroplastic isoform X2 [Cornus florida]
MELPFLTSLHTVSGTSLCPFSSKSFFKCSFLRRRKFSRILKCNVKPLRIELGLEKDSILNENRNSENWVSGILRDDCEYVEVIGIGSRKEAVLDFCLNSSLCSSSLRFWNILTNDSVKVKLQQRLLGKDITPRIVEAPLAWQSCSKSIILVASAGYSSDHVTAINNLKTVNCANGLSVSIIVKPFSFEGRRRQDEVKDLIDKLQEYTNLCIVIDTDELLKKDLVTLDEALKTANNAVLMAINAISILISEMHKKLLDVPNSGMNELKVPEVIKILKSCKEVKIGFGAGYNINTSIVRAIYDCPFLSIGVKDLNGVVICILSSSGDISSSDLRAFLKAFRQTTEYMGETVISMVHEPNLEPNIIVTTVITLGGQETSQKSGIFSKLAQHFPFIFNLLRRHSSPEKSHISEEMKSPDSGEFADSGELSNIILEDGSAESFGIYSAEIQTLLSKNGDETYSLRDYGDGSEPSEIEFPEAATDSSSFYNPDTEGAPAYQREPLIRWNLGPGYQIAQDWAKEGATESVTSPMLHNLSIYKLPVGVKPSEELEDSPITLKTTNYPTKTIEDDMKAQPEVTPVKSWDALTDAGVDAVMDFSINASSLLKGTYSNVSKKQGVLSVRAASMLEAERDSQKKWSPMVEMKYRGGIYRGRCQGGLPEGKGCLSLGDGSMYDGMWRFGKRSGLGTFYFSNGDVFQGSWRDDVMHGKGWFYFHTGDRWFANFWKGKANGEGRFYSKPGDVFFGQFKDGWRHGHFLCVNVDGERCLEIWDEGVLVRREQLDSDAGAV